NINGCADILYTKPQDEEQEVYFKRYEYLKDQIYFCNYSESLPCIINERNELRQLSSPFILNEPINPDWVNPEINCNQDLLDIPISFKQQRIHLKFNNYGCELFF